MAEKCEESRRKGDFEFAIGPLSFKGHGVNVLVGALTVITLGLAAATYMHMIDSKGQTDALTKMAQGQMLTSCLISRSQEQREAQLENPNSFCRRFARGEP